MTKIVDFSALIFDMDGLVLDTETTYCIAWQKAATEMGCEFSTAFCLSMSGLHSHDVKQKLIKRCGNSFDLAVFTQLSGQYWREHVNQFGITVKKGFFTVLEVLKKNNTPFCLATNSPQANALECLELAGLEGIFTIVISRDLVKQGKPAADIFLLAAERLMRPISECLVIEDSTTGIQAANNAEAPSVYIPSVLPYDEKTAQQANYLLNDLDELAQML